MDLRLNVYWFRLQRLTGKLWFLPAAFSVVAVVTVGLAYFFGGALPDELPFTIDRDGLQAILTILGSSMLTVAVFALSTLVGAVARASQSTTPRAVPLIVEDRTAQTSISIFVGAFLFSVVGIIGLSAGVYSDGGRLILFLVSVIVVLAVVVALIRWIGRISAMGRTSETVRQVEHAAEKTLAAFARSPNLDCVERSGSPTGSAGIGARRSGFVQHIDVKRLERIAEANETVIDVVAMPGAFVAAGDPLLLVGEMLDEDDAASAAKAFTVDDDRTFGLDPRYGLTVLAEIAMKALSPGINDTGTAIEAISAQTRVLLTIPKAAEAADDDDEGPANPHVTVPSLTADVLITDAFRGVARDGAQKVEILLFIIECLAALARNPYFGRPAREMAEEVVARAEQTLSFEPDRVAVQAAVRASVA